MDFITLAFFKRACAFVMVRLVKKYFRVIQYSISVFGWFLVLIYRFDLNM